MRFPTIFILIIFSIFSSLAHCQEVEEKPIEGDKERMDLITACWMLTIQDQALNAIQLDKVLNISKEKIRLLEKIQIEMVRRCFRIISVKEAEKVIDALTDPKLVPLSYRAVVQDFTYEDFTDSSFSLELDQFDLFLQTLIIELEKNMGKLFKVDRSYNDVRVFGINSKTLLFPIILILIGVGLFLKYKSIPFLYFKQIIRPQQQQKEIKNKKCE